jgi:hypothetical protein
MHAAATLVNAHVLLQQDRESVAGSNWCSGDMMPLALQAADQQ